MTRYRWYSSQRKWPSVSLSPHTRPCILTTVSAKTSQVSQQPKPGSYQITVAANENISNFIVTFSLTLLLYIWYFLLSLTIDLWLYTRRYMKNRNIPVKTNEMHEMPTESTSVIMFLLIYVTNNICCFPIFLHKYQPIPWITISPQHCIQSSLCFYIFLNSTLPTVHFAATTQLQTTLVHPHLNSTYNSHLGLKRK
jgi:hypothetical protein